jgi:hypothetical protein
MRKVMKINSLIIFMLAICLMTAGVSAAGEAQTVKGKTYDLWVSQSFAGPPYDPFHDCAIFTASTMSLAQCADAGPLTDVPLFGTPIFSLWLGTVPCGGLDLFFMGTSFDGSAIGAVDVMGGFGWGITESTTFGAEGVANPGCVLVQTDGVNPYSAE